MSGFLSMADDTTCGPLSQFELGIEIPVVGAAPFVQASVILSALCRGGRPKTKEAARTTHRERHGGGRFRAAVVAELVQLQ